MGKEGAGLKKGWGVREESDDFCDCKVGGFGILIENSNSAIL